MGGKGSADQSGMWQALISAQAANQAYQFGQQELDWAKTQWNQEFPYMQDIAKSEIASMKQTADFSRNQQQFYKEQYQPMEAEFNKKATEWASPENVALEQGKAMANVNEAINAQKASAQEQLEGYGINPGSTRYAALDKAMAVQGGAAAAGAGTQAGMATRMQGMQLLSSGVNTGRGFPGAVTSLTSASTGAGAAGSQGITSGMTAGSNMMTAPATWYNAGANNMGVYVNAVNGYNQSQAQFAQANAAESAGWGSLAGGMMGMMTSPFKPWMMAERGGEVRRFDGGGDVDVSGGPITGVAPVGVGAMPSRYFQAGPAQQNQVQQGQPPTAIPSQPPSGGTPGGIITPQMSPSGGQVPDDVDAKLTVGEFVMPRDVVNWRGKEYFYKEIDKARQKEAEANMRGDIGGEPSGAIPSRNPQFVSRPNAMPNSQAAMPPRQQAPMPAMAMA